MLNMEHQREHFKDHVATYNDFGSIKVIDFKKPGSCDYRIRFMFEDDYCRLHISGDLGELIATNYNNMTFEKFEGDYVNNPSYFEGKIDCSSRPLYEWDIDAAWDDMRKFIKDFKLSEYILNTRGSCYPDISDDEYIDIYIEECLEDFGENNGGMDRHGVEKFMDEVYSDFWETAGDIGKRQTGIIQVYLLAYKLAMKQLRDNKVI